MKNEKGNIPVIVPESLKLSVTLGLMDPRILVKKEMAKKTRKIRKSQARFFFRTCRWHL